ncbi:MAG: ATP-dependent RNA helicase HrpA [Succinivibrionaceae bacterium]
MSVEISYSEIKNALKQVLISDKIELGRRTKMIFGDRNHPKNKELIDSADVERLVLDVHKAVEKTTQRNATIPEITYQEELPISKEHENIAKLIKENQVIILAGDTGSGKTTQLPKICLEAGLGRRGIIGHTQTRRLATRTVAERISNELKVPLGTVVGYKVRFGDKTSPNTIIKLMTDGVLLAELEQDRYLNDYEVLIIDEAHERSLNIDFILGFLKELLLKRKDLKVIVTSATIDLERFSKHFNNAPIKVVEGRTYPVEVRYAPLDEYLQDENGETDIDEDSLQRGILKAIHELENEKLGDILVFLNGERDIMEMADFLRKANLKGTEILPLYARLSNQEQNRVFASHVGRRIILATNVAETSVTVPGIRYVIDPGTARISRYNSRTKVQRLPIEPISQASANQRKGRCGRVAEGICIRLYGENDFITRSEFTDPEILRTNLAAVILRMLNLRIKDIAAFPFIEPPDYKQIKDGIKLLEELGAITFDKNKIGNNDKDLVHENIKLTAIGKAMSKFPCDPRLSRMLIEANEQNALKEMLIIASNLSAQETRERPLQWREAANEQHSRFNDKKSDFLSIINLYNYLQKIINENSNSQLRKIMRKEFLSYLRMREWFDILSQLQETVDELGYKVNEAPATYEQIHRSILCGLLGQIGTQTHERFEYVGPRSNHFYIFPGSGLSKSNPRWIVAAEITETSKLYARNVAEIDPLWTEKYAKNIIRYSYYDEHWSKSMGAVMAYQKGMLYGLPVINNRKVNYTKVNPLLCRELFIREGLVSGEFNTSEIFFKHNRKLINDVLELEDKSRRRDLLVNDDALFAFYDERIPEDVVEAKSFEKWWQNKKQNDPEFLNFDSEMLKQKDTSMISDDLYPEKLNIGRFRLKLQYCFDPTSDIDGVTAIIPVSILNQLKSEDFLWLIPGLRLELYTSLIKSLPKSLRRKFVPAPNYAQALNDCLNPSMGYFWEVLCKQMTKIASEKIKQEDFDLTFLPKHLKFNFRVIDIKNRVLLESRDLEYIKHKLKDEVKASLEQVVKELPCEKGITSWTFDVFPKKQKRVIGGLEIVAYPALKDCGDSVSMELYESEEEALYQMNKGLKRLIMKAIPSPLNFLEEKLPNKAKLAMYFNAVGTVKNLIEDMESYVLDEIINECGGVAWNEQDFKKIVECAKANIYDRVYKIATICEKILVKANEVRKKLKGKMDLRTAYAYSDIGGQLSRLIYKGFVTETGPMYFPHLERYLDAMLKRIEKVPQDPNRDLMMLNKYKDVEHDYESLLGKYAGKILPTEVRNVRFMLEELRVSFFAQSIKTLYPVSEKRVHNEIERLKVLC